MHTENYLIRIKATVHVVYFRLNGANAFHVKAENGNAGSRCRQNLKFDNFTWSFGRLRQQIAPIRMPHVQHAYFSSFIQSYLWFVALALLLSFLKLADISNMSSRCWSNLWTPAKKPTAHHNDHLIDSLTLSSTDYIFARRENKSSREKHLGAG